jgi:hypothetical protein
MAIVMCFRLNMQEEDILEHNNAKCTLLVNVVDRSLT